MEQGVRVVAALVAAWTLTTSATSVRAQTLVDEGYSLDLIELPVYGAGRVVSMGGAFAALAEGIDGVPFNPAGYAARNPREHKFFEWEPSIGLSLGTSNNDVWNAGRQGPFVDDAVVIDFGLRFQIGMIGLGGVLHYEVFTTLLDEDLVTVTALRGHVGAGIELLDGQLVLGGGIRLLRFGYSASSSSAPDLVDFYSFSGVGLEVGAVFRPVEHRFRLGVSLRTAVHANVALELSSTAGGVPQLPRPRRAVYPFELRFGGAIQLGRRPLNFRTFERKHVERRVMRELRARWCEREREQVLRELVMTGREVDPARLRCPRLRERARDPAFRRAEEERRDEERDAAEDEIDALEDAFDAHLFALADQVPREAYLLAASLILYGTAGDDAIGLDGFFDQVDRRRRHGPSIGVRVGVEMEPWARRLKLRGGLYLEPDRSRTLNPRLHATWGFDFRLFRWDLFGLIEPFDARVSFYFDAARRYVTYGVGIGLWH